MLTGPHVHYPHRYGAFFTANLQLTASMLTVLAVGLAFLLVRKQVWLDLIMLSQVEFLDIKQAERCLKYKRNRGWKDYQSYQPP